MRVWEGRVRFLLLREVEVFGAPFTASIGLEDVREPEAGGLGTTEGEEDLAEDVPFSGVLRGVGSGRPMAEGVADCCNEVAVAAMRLSPPMVIEYGSIETAISLMLARCPAGGTWPAAQR